MDTLLCGSGPTALIGLANGLVLEASHPACPIGPFAAPTYTTSDVHMIYDPPAPMPLHPIGDDAPRPATIITGRCIAIDRFCQSARGEVVRCGFDKPTGRWYVRYPRRPVAD